MSIYHTCPSCGANLDPGEQCDCEKMKYTFADTLIIGFDNAQNDDHRVLIVARKIGDKIEVLNQFMDDDAKKMYLKLTEQLIKIK